MRHANTYSDCNGNRDTNGNTEPYDTNGNGDANHQTVYPDTDSHATAPLEGDS